MECQKGLVDLQKQFKRYNITQCALFKCKSKNKLIDLLHIDEAEYNDIKKVVHYHSFNIDKKGGNEKREITAPDQRIKTIQTRMLKLLQKVERPVWLISGEKGKCYIDNGKAHLLSNYILTVDIRKFYDNCKREYVYNFFKNRMQMSGDLAGVCTDLVTYNGGIPTGCPTSQLIAFYAYENMFKEIAERTEQYGCIFTVYVDDMTFSSEKAFEVNALKRDIDILLRKYGHKPKYKKVKYYSKGKSTPITGTIVTSKHELKVPNNLQQKVYNGFQGVKDLKGRELTVIERQKIVALKGQIQASRNIEPDRFPEITRLVKDL